jgi:hypothetical protein
MVSETHISSVIGKNCCFPQSSKWLHLCLILPGRWKNLVGTNFMSVRYLKIHNLELNNFTFVCGWLQNCVNYVNHIFKFGLWWIEHSQPWRWRHYVSPKRWHLPTSLHGAKTQNVIIIKKKRSNYNDDTSIRLKHLHFYSVRYVFNIK